MTNELNLFNIYEQNLNFLIGAGASNGFLPTLALKIKDAEGNKLTFESLAKAYEDDKEIKTISFSNPCTVHVQNTSILTAITWCHPEAIVL